MCLVKTDVVGGDLENMGKYLQQRKDFEANAG